MAAGRGGELCNAAAGRVAAALRHVLHICVGTDCAASLAVLAVCALSVTACRLPSGRQRQRAVGLSALLPGLTAVLLLRRHWPALVRLTAGQLLMTAAADRRPQLLPWRAISLLLAGAEVCWLAARAPVLPAVVLAAVAACLVERCVQWRRTVQAGGVRPLPLGAPAVSPHRRPTSLWRTVLRLQAAPDDGAEDRLPAEPASALSACLPLAAVLALVPMAVACECLFPWDALLFHSRGSVLQLLQLLTMWTALQAVWLCPLIVLQTAANLILREGAPRLDWWSAVRSGSVSSVVSVLVVPTSGWLRRLLEPADRRLAGPLLCLGWLAAAAAAGGARLLLWAALVALSCRLERLSQLPAPAAALAGRLQLACCAVLLRPELTSLDVYRTWEELQFLPVLLPTVGVITGTMDTAVSRTIPGDRARRTRIGSKLV